MKWQLLRIESENQKSYKSDYVFSSASVVHMIRYSASGKGVFHGG